MRTETTKTTETVTITETVYITEDGKTFKYDWEAEEHEKELLEQQIKTSPDVIFKDNGCFPYEPWMDEDESSFYWVKPLNEKGIELVRKVYPADEYYPFEVNRWTSIEVADNDIYYRPLENTIYNLECLGKSLGFKVSIEWED